MRRGILTKDYKPDRSKNRMKHEGDVIRARENFLVNPSNNLKFLLKNRYSWMNKYILTQAKGLEVGCGSGLSKFFINNKSFLLTDFSDNSWLDVKNVDALATQFEDNHFDFVISSNMLHHVPYPLRFLKEMHRILKVGGVLLIQEINASLFMRLILRFMRHEGYSFSPDVFDEKVICTDKNNLWDANCAIPNLLFDDYKRFQKNVPYFKISYQSFEEFFIFLNSGGVIAKTAYLPLPTFLLKGLKFLDDILAKTLPKVFALQRRVVLEKIS